MIPYIVVSRPGRVYGPFDSEQAALDWLNMYNLRGLGWRVEPLMPIASV